MPAEASLFDGTHLGVRRAEEPKSLLKRQSSQAAELSSGSPFDDEPATRRFVDRSLKSRRVLSFGVEPRGIEPLTSALPVRRSPS